MSMVAQGHGFRIQRLWSCDGALVMDEIGCRGGVRVPALLLYVSQKRRLLCECFLRAGSDLFYNTRPYRIGLR
jgi:hypothetical protein